MSESSVDRYLTLGFGHASLRDDYIAVIDWLAKRPQDHWLFAILHLQWDNGTIPFWWMVDHPDCDLSVAAQIFWEGNPEWVVEKTNWSDPRQTWGEIAALIDHIVLKTRLGQFRISDMGLARKCDLHAYADEINAISVTQCPIQPVPESLIDGFGSRAPENDPFQMEAERAEISRCGLFL